MPDTLLNWSLRNKIKDIAQKQNQVQQEQQQPKKDWLDRVRSAISGMGGLFGPPKEYKEVYDPELGKMVPGERLEYPLGTKAIERLKFEWESDWPQWLGLGAFMATYGLLKYIPVRGETIINKGAKTFAKNNLPVLKRTFPDVIKSAEDAQAYAELALKQKLYQATADMKGLDALKTIARIMDHVAKYKLPAPVTLPMLAQKIAGAPSLALTNKLVHAGLDKIGAEALAGSMHLMKEGVNKLVIGQVIDDFVERSMARGEGLAPLSAEEKLGFTAMREALDERVTGVLEKEVTAPEVAPKAEIPEEITLGVKPPTKPPIPPTPPPIEMPEFAEEPMEDPIAKLNELLKQAKPLRRGLEKAYTKERAKRIAEVDRFINETIDKVGGEEGYRMILSKLKGELVSPEAKVGFEPIKEKLTEEQLKALFIRIWKHPYLDNWEKVSTADGLSGLLIGGIPQPKKLVLLEEVYGSELIKNILSKRVWGAKATDFLVELANVPRAALATADMSAFLRQGIVEMAAHPAISAKVVAKTFQFAFSSKVFEQYFIDLKEDKLYPLMRKSGLAITDPRTGGMVEREEAFISRFLQKIPIIKIPVLFAERSYVGFLNKLRVDIFKTWADELLSKDFSPTKDPEYFKAAADVVNTFTGRGSLGKAGNRIGPQLNTLFFSPRLIAARFNGLNPVWYVKQPKEIRTKAIGDFAKFVAAGLTTLALIKASGFADVEVDPRSSDFGKIRIGNTRFDIWGGFQQWARVFAQITTGERKSTVTGEIISLNKDEYPFTTRKEVILRFVEGKFAPVPALVNELMSGAKTFGGEEMTVESVAFSKFIPMYIQDVAEAYADGGLGRAVGVSIPAFLGVGVQTWQPRGKDLKGIIRTRLRRRRKSLSRW